MSADKKWPPAKGAGQQPARPATPARQFKPAVAQTKNSAPAGARPHPVAPPVYRPQAKPHVLQLKATQSPPPKTPPAAPPAYRPQPAPRVLQTKTTQHQRGVAQPDAEVKRPAAPPAYRPEPKPVAQRKAQAAAQARRPQAAPPTSRLQAGKIERSAQALSGATGRFVIQRLKIDSLDSKQKNEIPNLKARYLAAQGNDYTGWDSTLKAANSFAALCAAVNAIAPVTTTTTTTTTTVSQPSQKMKDTAVNLEAHEGVTCSVIVKNDKDTNGTLGGTYTTKFREKTKDNHAERKWWKNHGNDLVKGVKEGTYKHVTFNVSDDPCGSTTKQEGCNDWFGGTVYKELTAAGLSGTDIVVYVTRSKKTLSFDKNGTLQ